MIGNLRLLQGLIGSLHQAEKPQLVDIKIELIPI